MLKLINLTKRYNINSVPAVFDLNLKVNIKGCCNNFIITLVYFFNQEQEYIFNLLGEDTLVNFDVPKEESPVSLFHCGTLRSGQKLFSEGQLYVASFLAEKL